MKLKPHSLEILTIYDHNRLRYDDFRRAIEHLIKIAVEDPDYTPKPHMITSRLKTRESLEGKLIKRENKYDSIDQITDIVGLRIITYFQDDIEKISQLIEKIFVIDPENSIDKSVKSEKDLDRFGYLSKHYVCSMHTHRTDLFEYQRFKDLKFELQIRTNLQHSWAEIEHDLGYKGFQIPERAKRTFYRIAAFLEQADIEFVKLREEIQTYEKEIKANLAKSQIQITTTTTAAIPLVEIDYSSLTAFAKTSEIIRNILDISIRQVQVSIVLRNNLNLEWTNVLMGMMKKYRITSINDLEIQLKKYFDKIVEKIVAYLESLKNQNVTTVQLSYLTVFDMFFEIMEEGI